MPRPARIPLTAEQPGAWQAESTIGANGRGQRLAGRLTRQGNTHNRPLNVHIGSALLGLAFLLAPHAWAATDEAPDGAPMTHAEATARLVDGLESAQSLSARLSKMLRGESAAFDFAINFDYDQSNIRREFEPLLNAIGRDLALRPERRFILSIDGHTDWDGSDEYNMGLSKRRADAVERYFATHFNVNFKSTHISFWGERRPFRPNVTRDGMARNRRAEFAIRPAPDQDDSALDDRYAVAFSADGQFALTGAKGDTLTMRNAQLDCRQRSLSGHFGQVLAASFTPNGRLAVSGGEDGTVRVWDAATGREIQTHYGHRGPVYSVAVGSGGRQAVSGSDDRTVRLWNLVGNTADAILKGHRGSVTAVALSPNEWYSASGDRDGTVIVWHLGNKNELRRIQAGDAAISSIVFFDNDRFMSASLDGSAKIWEASTGNLLYTLSIGGPAILAADISKDGRFAVTAEVNGGVTIWNMATQVKFRPLVGHSADVVFAAFSADGSLILTADKDLSHKVWDFDSGGQIRQFVPILPAGVPDSRAASGSGAIDLWTEPRSGIQLVRLPAGCYAMGCGSWSDNCSDDELPVHEVCVDEVWIGQHEVTQEEWQKVMHTNPSRFKRGGNHPVEQVSWHRAQDFVCELNELTGMEFRLPTEAEWEYACRSGGDEVTYPVATKVSDPSTQSTIAAEPGENAADYPVEPQAANESGLAGMGDGVWEWIADVYEDNLNVPVYSRHWRNNPLYTGSNDYHFSTAIYPRVNRGGSWDIGDNPTRCSLRHFDDPGLNSFFHGFRVAVSGARPSRDRPPAGKP